MSGHLAAVVLEGCHEDSVVNFLQVFHYNLPSVHEAIVVVAEDFHVPILGRDQEKEIESELVQLFLPEIVAPAGLEVLFEGFHESSSPAEKLAPIAWFPPHYMPPVLLFVCLSVGQRTPSDVPKGLYLLFDE